MNYGCCNIGQFIKNKEMMPRYTKTKQKWYVSEIYIFRLATKFYRHNILKIRS